MSANSSQAWMGFLHDKTTTSKQLLQGQTQHHHAGWSQFAKLTGRHALDVRNIEGGEGIGHYALDPELLGQIGLDILE